ncbi:MAG: hypothetical protein LIO37_02780, partial [Clostridiales bacterium]|nr:hypothetical protein [Clostridiales bacterium]
MGFGSILRNSPYHLKASEIEYSSFFQDLNIDLIVERILQKWPDYPITKYFYYPAYTEDEVLCRTQLYEDLEDVQLRHDLVEFSRGMKRARQYLEYRERLLELLERQAKRKDLTYTSAKTAGEIKYRHLLYDAAGEYVWAVEYLADALGRRAGEPREDSMLSDADGASGEAAGAVGRIKSRGLTELYDFLQEYCKSEEFTDLKADVEEMREELRKLHFQFELKSNKLILHDVYDTRDARQEFMDRCGMHEPKTRREDAPTQMQSPFPNIVELKEFEGLLLSMLHQPHKDVFKRFKDFEKKHEDCVRPELLQFEEEIQVYLAAHQFFDEMKEYGFSFAAAETIPAAGRAAAPASSGSRGDGMPLCSVGNQADLVNWELCGNYDAALACKYSFTPEKVITNDSVLAADEHFYVISGPNQGGKTTFARAAGQAVWFHQMGFPVPGTYARLPVYSSLLTHFPQEEEFGSGAGRLKEELERMQPMMDESRRSGFVVLNELLTTAPSYDA